MAKKSKKSIYKNIYANGGLIDIDGYLQLAGMAGSALQGTNSSEGIVGGGILKGGATGASIGSIIPGIGTGLGAGIGAIVGGIGGAFKNKEREEAEAAQRKLEMQQANLQSVQASQNANRLYQNGGNLGNPPITKLNPKEEQLFKSWYSKVAKYKELNPNPDSEDQYYDYRGYWKNEKNRDDILKENSDVHFIDKYKLPGHPTFSSESMYSNNNTPGGEWVQRNNSWYFIHSPYTSNYANKTNEYLQGSGEYAVPNKESMYKLDNFSNDKSSTKFMGGGSLSNNTTLNQYNGLTHEEGGLPLDENTEVEDGETRGIGTTQDYIFSDTLRPNPKSKKTYSDKSKDIERKYKGYQNDKYAMKAKDMELAKLMYDQESKRKDMFEKDMGKMTEKYPNEMKYGGININPWTTFANGGYMALGGPGDPPIDPNSNKYSVRSIDKFSPEQLDQHRSLVKQLHSFYPETFTNETPTQYAFDYLRNPQVSKKLLDKNARWNQKDEEVLGYYYPSIENKPELTVGLPSGSEEIEIANRLKNKFPITTSQFSKNPEAFKSNMDANEYNAYLRYITGKEDPYKVSKVGLTRETVMRDAQDAINETGSQPLPYAYGGMLGDPDNPPPKKKLLRSQYDAEVAKRKAAGNTDLSDIEVFKLSDLGSGASLPEGTSVFDLEDIDNDFKDKYFHPNSAAISKYKALLDKGKREEAENLILGYYDKSKEGSGEFKESTHGEGVKLGTTIPVNLRQVANLDLIGDKLPKEVTNLIQAVNYDPTLYKRCGGFLKYGGMANGGPIDPRIKNLRDAYRSYSLFTQTSPQDLKINETPYYGQPLDMNNPFGSTPVTPGDGNTPQYKTNPYNTGFQYNPNNTQEGMKFNKPGQHWTNDNINTYTPDYVWNTLKNRGFNDDQLKEMQQKGWLDQFFTYQAGQKNSDFANSVYKDDDRFGPEHMMALTGNKYNIGPPDKREKPIEPIPSIPPGQFQTTPPQLPPFGWKGEDFSGPPSNITPEDDGNFGGPPTKGNLKPFGPDWLASGISMLPNIGMGIGNINLANNLKFDRTNAEIYNPDYVDPTRAIQESRNQYAGAKDLIRQNSNSGGNYLSNILGAVASQSEAESGIQSQYDNTNAGIYNQAAQFNTQNRQRARDINAQIQQNEMLQKTQLKQEGYQNLSDALNTGINTYYQSKRNADMMNLAGGENFYYKRIGSLANQKPVKVFKGNGYHYYEDPVTGQTRFIDPNTGKIIKDTKKTNKYKKDLNG